MKVLARGPLFFFYFYMILVSSVGLACEATLDIKGTKGFIQRGTLGGPQKYIQKVYSGDNMSFSTVVLAPLPDFNSDKLLLQSSRSMSATVARRTGAKSPQIQVLHNHLLASIDRRLAFLSYVKYGTQQSVNIEASGAILAGSCWALVRFTGLKKSTKEEALNVFAALIQNTKLEN
jgi:hypothetical protein